MVIPDRESFGRLLSPSAPHHRSVTRLHAVFEALEPEAALEARTEALIELTRWLRNRRGVPKLTDATPGELPELSRLRLLVFALEEIPACRERLAAVVGSILAEASALDLFAQLGLPADRGLLGETLDRLSRRFLPEPSNPKSIAELLTRLFPSSRDLTWLSAAPIELVLRFSELLAVSSQPGFWQPLERAALEGLGLIATRVSAVGLYNALRARSPSVPLAESPFFSLPRETDQFVKYALLRDESRTLMARERCQSCVLACRQTMAAIVKGLEGSGVSVDVVYRLELIDKNLARYADLLEPSVPRPLPEQLGVVKRLLVSLLDARQSDRALGEILRSSTHLMARKIIERAGETGEHYITTTRGEYLKMLLSAGGGGVLTTGTCALKFLVGWAHFAPFVEGMVAATNYAGSFLIMQLCGFTLATKQPSMTAAALAGSIGAHSGEVARATSHAKHGPVPESQNDATLLDVQRLDAGHKGLANLVALIARITRSQLAAALGNIGLVIPTTLAFDHFFRQHFGHSFLDAETARYVLHSLHPTQSGTIFYAALTGVLLWVASLGAGWLENWAAYRRIPEAIGQHRLGRLVGRRTMSWFGRAFHKNISGIGGNTTLGFLLGMTPVFGKFFGLPLDVRHVTLSTGALTLSVCALQSEGLVFTELWPAAVGIAIIGVLNFGVSFVLALLVALRARQVERGDRVRLLRSIVVTFLRSPLQFFIPPRAPLDVPVHGPVTLPPPAPANR